ncbi:MAG TPA: hypothetical protein VJM76_02930 [Gammaproteobacteria bacterium]|nr:hypothetical protein [Gammaproteobacteria bacterium]
MQLATAGVEKLYFSTPAVRHTDVPPFFKHLKCLKNEAKQKTLFLLCVVEKVLDGLFQHPTSGLACLQRLLEPVVLQA